MLLVAQGIVGPGKEGGLARVHAAGPGIRADDKGGRLVGVRDVLGGEDERGGDDAYGGDEVADEIALAVEEVGQRGPEEGRADADGGHEGRDGVKLGDAVLVERVALQVQAQQAVGAEGLGLAREDPEDHEAPEELGGQRASGEAPGPGRAVGDPGHAGEGEGLLVVGQVEGLGGRRRVGEEEEAVDGDGDGDEPVNSLSNVSYFNLWPLLNSTTFGIYKGISRGRRMKEPKWGGRETKHAHLHEQPPPPAEPAPLVQ